VPRVAGKKIRSYKNIPEEEIVKIAEQVPWTMSPTSDLVAAVRQRFGVSDEVASKAVERVLEKGSIKQVVRTEIEPSPAGSFNVPTVKTRWVRKERPKEVPKPPVESQKPTVPQVRAKVKYTEVGGRRFAVNPQGELYKVKIGRTEYAVELPYKNLEDLQGIEGRPDLGIGKAGQWWIIINKETGELVAKARRRSEIVYLARQLIPKVEKRTKRPTPAFSHSPYATPPLPHEIPTAEELGMARAIARGVEWQPVEFYSRLKPGDYIRVHYKGKAYEGRIAGKPKRMRSGAVMVPLEGGNRKWAPWTPKAKYERKVE